MSRDPAVYEIPLTDAEKKVLERLKEKGVIVRKLQIGNNTRIVLQKPARPTRQPFEPK